MAELRDQVEHWTDATLAAIATDRIVGIRGDIDERGTLYLAVSGELRPLVYQVAEMARHEPDKLVVAAEFLAGLLAREPLRSGPTWDAPRIVLGLFQLGLIDVLRRVEALTADERAALRPGYARDAAAAVTAAFDPTYLPPADDEPDPVTPEEDALPAVTAAEPTDADLLALL